ncbi:RBBP9/YdeN family alpha/beta hydrolase [Nocardia sp. CA-151230]|uniref:RBBP9/YdeN family alpha/beta hydrolase n=1 Tax=Nocardia sp. CA-151230 TaxID=3239982 RepID=UPI003D8A67E4
MNPTTEPIIVMVPGLADDHDDHWQTRLATEVNATRTVPNPPVPAHLNRHAWVTALDSAVRELPHPVVLVAHGAGVLTTVHWARHATGNVLAALLVTPPDVEIPLPTGYPTTDQLTHHGWNPIPRRRLPFPSILATSTNDVLASRRRVAGMAETWGSRLVDLGPVGHLDPRAGYRMWPYARTLLDELMQSLHRTNPASTTRDPHPARVKNS